MTLMVREDYVNATENTRFGDSGDWEQAWTDDRGKLFRSCRAEYGRCISKIYADTATRTLENQGWVFLKRIRYEDASSHADSDYYLREVWVHVKEES